MPCQMSSKELYTISHLNVKLLNIEKVIDREEQHKFDANAEILIVGRMIIIFFFGKTRQCFMLLKKGQNPKVED